MRTFSTAEAASLAGLTERQLRRLVAEQVVVPSVSAGTGRGSVARFNFDDLRAMRVAWAVRQVCGAKAETWRIAKAVSVARGGAFTGLLMTDGEKAWVSSKPVEKTLETVALVIDLEQVSDQVEIAVERTSLAAEAA